MAAMDAIKISDGDDGILKWRGSIIIRSENFHEVHCPQISWQRQCINEKETPFFYMTV